MWPFFFPFFIIGFVLYLANLLDYVLTTIIYVIDYPPNTIDIAIAFPVDAAEFAAVNAELA